MQSAPSPTGIDEPRGLSFADGFQFGCGFFVAAAVAAIVMLLLLTLLGLILSLLGVGVLEDLLSRADLLFPLSAL
ncbi:MAG: hypothetical protein H8D78_10570 [Chloroflexi bacterium]|nr:hypothetical protein [Chloroflexota bacterium]